MFRLLLCSLLVATGTLLAQAPARHALLDGANHLTFTPVEAPFRAVSLRYGERALSPRAFPYLQYRYRTTTTRRTDWQRWHRDAHTAPEGGYLHAGLLLLPANLTELEVYVATLDYAPADAALLRVYTPGASTATAAAPRGSACAPPPITPRATWCPAGNCAPHPNPSPTTPSHLIVHHSATANTTTDYAAVVRAIWDFHVNTNGWSDIGYNWLVDPAGTIYAGRGNNVVGAHFCGQNSATSGVCVLGNYVSTPPAPAALAALESLLAWKADALNLDAEGTAVHVPSGLSLARLSGHRDGCNTTCPGDSLYVRLPALRTAVAYRIAVDCEAALAAPSQLAAALDGTAGVRLTWQDNSPNETAFELERAPAVNGPFVLLATTVANDTSYLDAAVASSTPYFYRLRAVRNVDTTAYSNQVFILTGTVVGTAARAPLAFTVFPNPAREHVQLRWTTAQPYQLILLDPLGRTVARRHGRGARAVLPLPVGAAGVYYLRVETPAGRGTRRIMVH